MTWKILVFYGRVEMLKKCDVNAGLHLLTRQGNGAKSVANLKALVQAAVQQEPHNPALWLRLSQLYTRLAGMHCWYMHATAVRCRKRTWHSRVNASCSMASTLVLLYWINTA